MPTDTESLRRAPKKMFRVVGYDKYNYEDYVVGDFGTDIEAINSAWIQASKPNASPPNFSDLYLVFDDQGNCLERASYGQDQSIETDGLCWFCGNKKSDPSVAFPARGITSSSKLFGWRIQSKNGIFPRCTGCRDIHSRLKYIGYFGTLVGILFIIYAYWPLYCESIDWLFDLDHDNLLFFLFLFGVFIAGFWVMIRIPKWSYRLAVNAYLKIRRLAIRTPWEADEFVRRKMIGKKHINN